MLPKRLSTYLFVPLAAPLLLLGGCNSLQYLSNNVASSVGLVDDQPKGYSTTAESLAKRSGIAVSDEPLATRAGAAALASSGNAVDAVTTMFFAMTATYPVAAGLGGGGICLVRDTTGRVTEFDFLARSPSGGGAYGVPAAVRGFSAMQKQFGALPWQRVVAPGEAYAATGFPVSQALSVRLADAQSVLRLDAGLAAEFLDPSGQPHAADTEVRNPALGRTLSLVRRDGPDGFYSGVTAAQIMGYAASQGGLITAADMAVAAQSGPAHSRGLGNLTVHIPGPRTGAGAFAARMLDNLSRARGDAAIGAAIGQTDAGFGIAGLPRDMGSTGFAAVDSAGEAASCAVTLNGPFGSGRTAGNTGIQLAASPASGAAGLAGAFLTPVLAANSDGIALAGAGAGGPNGTAAAEIALLQVSGGRGLGRRGDLRGTGAAPFDTVNMISCSTDACVALTDPGAHGAGAVAETISGR